jgi:protein SCO1
MNNSSSKMIIRITVIFGLAIAIISLYLLITMQAEVRPIAGQGSPITDDVKIGGQFNLTDQDGKPFSSKNLNGKLSLIYFGFTYCPDICPTSLQKLTKVLNAFDKYNIDVNAVFITVDPDRDTASVLKEYISHFHRKFIALTGSNDQIRQVADQFKVYYAKAPNSVSDHYMLDHSSFVYLLDKNGKYLKHFYLNSTSDEIIEFIRVNDKN